MSDPAGWYPDPTTKHELRYWDGYAWADNVSDKGVSGSDALGGKPMPAPSEAAAKAAQGPSSSSSKSKTPLYVGVGVGVLVVALVAVFLLKGDDDGDKRTLTQLADQPVTFEDDVADIVRPVVHPVRVKANTVVLITVKSDNEEVEPGIVVLTKQAVVDEVAAKIDGARDLLTSQLKDACSNMREEDIGATGDVVYLARASDEAGAQLDAFMVVPVEGDFEFVPVLVNSKGQCEAGKSSLTIEAKFVDFSSVNNIDDLASVISEDPELNDLIPG